MMSVLLPVQMFAILFLMNHVTAILKGIKTVSKTKNIYTLKSKCLLLIVINVLC